MRGFAQICFGLVFVATIVAFKIPVLWLAYYMVLPPLLLPVAYYYIFERHREGQDELRAALERIGDRLTDLAPPMPHESAPRSGAHLARRP